MPFLDVRRLLVDRDVLVVFGFLAGTWFLPGVVSTLHGPFFEPVRPVAHVLVVPAYLLDVLLSDGGIESLVSPVAEAVPFGGPIVRDAGLGVVFYGFAVSAVTTPTVTVETCTGTGAASQSGGTVAGDVLVGRFRSDHA